MGAGAHRRSLGFARDDKVEGGGFLLGAVRLDGQKETAGPSTTLRSHCKPGQLAFPRTQLPGVQSFGYPLPAQAVVGAHGVLDNAVGQQPLQPNNRALRGGANGVP